MTVRAPGRAADPRRRSIAGLLVVPAAALVAAILLLLRMHIEPPTVPPYALAPGDGGAHVLRAGEPFRLVVEPQGAVQGAVGARGYLLRGDEVRSWDPTFTVDRYGSVYLEGRVDSVFAGVPPGPWEIAIAVGRPETLPNTPREILLARDAGAGHAAWHLVREPVVLEGG